MPTPAPIPAIPQGKPLLILQSAAYEGSLARSAMDVALSFAVFAQAPTLLFAGEGVLALVSKQDPEAMGRKSLRKVIDSLPLYDVEHVYVEALALARFAIDRDQLPEFARIVDSAEIVALRSAAGHILSL